MLSSFLLQRFGRQTLVPEKEKSDEAEVRALLADQPKRLQHVLGVVKRADELLAVLKRDEKFGEQLRKAAFYHDIGYSATVRMTGFHPLDGALFLAERGETEEVVTAILFHSGAAGEAKSHPTTAPIYEELKIPREHFLLDALTFCDLQTSPTGERISMTERLDEICARYGSEHPVSKNMLAMKPEFEQAFQAVLKQTGGSFPSI